MKISSAVVLGGGGFIGNHLINRLKKEGYWVRAVDLKNPEFSISEADEYIVGDLRDPKVVFMALKDVSEVYQLAADMGGMGFISGENDAAIVHNSALINLNVAEASKQHGSQKIFFASSACVYPDHNQQDPNNPVCEENSVYPANPDSEYGWEKLFSERIYQTYKRNHNVAISIARFHNIFGPLGTWQGGREKAPAALSRKVAEAKNGDTIEVWGKGDQTRSFLFIDECLEGIRRLMQSDVTTPLNIGSEEMISINNLAKLIISISGKNLTINNIDGPEGVRGRSSDNNLIKEKLDWSPSLKLEEGLKITYQWVAKQVELSRSPDQPETTPVKLEK